MNKLQQLRDDLANVNILYVEDEGEVRVMTMDFLKNIFTHIDSATNGEEGLKLFKEKPYSIVITDLKMPKMNGREMLNNIRKLDKDVVLMIMTASDSDSDASEIVCDAYLYKPVKFMEFIEALEPLMNKVEQQSAKYLSKELL